MSKYSTLGKNTFIVFVGNVGSKVITFVMLPFYTTWLSVEDYGITDIINVYVTLLAYVVSCCIAESVFIFPKGQEKSIQTEYFSSSIAFLCFMVLISTVCFWGIQYVSVLLNYNNSFFNYIWYIYAILLSQLFLQLFQQFSRSINKINVYASTGIIQTLITALLSFILIPVYKVKGFVFSLIVANLASTFYSLLLSKGYSFISLKAVKIERCKEMLTYSLPLIPNGIMWWLVGAFNRPIMEAFIGMNAIGLFAVANKFPGLLTMLFGIFGISWQISVMEEYGKIDFERFYNNVFRIVMTFVSIVFLILSSFSHFFVTIFTTPNYYAAERYIPLLTLGAAFSVMSTMGGMVFSAVKQSRYYLYSSIWGACVAIVLNVVSIPIFGIKGAAFSICISFAAMALSRIVFAWKYVKLYNYYSYILYFLVGLIISFSFLYFDYDVNLILCLIALSALFVFNRKYALELLTVIKRRVL